MKKTVRCPSPFNPVSLIRARQQRATRAAASGEFTRDNRSGMNGSTLDAAPRLVTPARRGENGDSFRATGPDMEIDVTELVLWLDQLRMTDL
ncbi:MAG TPA: hypothetical protein VFY97_08000, partial [Rhodanobacteraceae bacterium]|nr:hypothetical protein [Rhodanobacteraceae bacterium]